MVVASMKTLIEAYNPIKHDKDIEWLSYHLRDMDLLELKEKGKWDGMDTLQDAFRDIGYANFVVYLENGELLGVFGISKAPLINNMHCIWFMGSTILESKLYAKRAFVKGSRKILRKWANEYGCLFNYAHKANTAIIAWLHSVHAIFYDTNDPNYKLFLIK